MRSKFGETFEVILRLTNYKDKNVKVIFNWFFLLILGYFNLQNIFNFFQAIVQLQNTNDYKVVYAEYNNNRINLDGDLFIFNFDNIVPDSFEKLSFHILGFKSGLQNVEISTICEDYW